MQANPSETKAEIRGRLRSWLKGISPEQRARLSREAGALLEQQPMWRNARSILFYSPLPDELDLSALWTHALQQGHRVMLPRFAQETAEYEICELDRRDGNLRRGRFGILEPDGTCPPVPLKQLDFALVPGLAFDPRGRRLGRGRGFYDRLLKEITAIKCGVAFDEQVQSEIPVEAHDIVVDCILTPTRWLDCGRARP